MGYCLNPTCSTPQNLQVAEFCQCGSRLRLADRYLALKPIAQGGFGRTFLAVDEAKELKPRCVIKQFFPQTLGGENLERARELFQQEALRLKELGNHDQIPELIDSLEQDDRQYLIQEFIDGQNLEQELQQGAFSEAQICQLLNDLLPVLQFIHDRQVIHRDIKPANIIRRNADQKLVLVDLGAAKYATGTALGKTGTVIGSAEYTAPEQTRGKAVFASDLYSLGATCIHLLTQMSPFDLFDSSDDRWAWRDCLSQPVSHSLGRVLDRMLHSGTKGRYQSANQVIADLNRRLTESLSSFAQEPPLLLPKAALPQRRNDRAIEVADGSIRTFSNSGVVAALAFPPGSQTLTASIVSRKVVDCAIKRWQLQANEPIFNLPQSVWINAIALYATGQTLIGGDSNGSLKFWELETGNLIGRIHAHDGQVCAIALAPDGQSLVSGGADGFIRVWNPNTGHLIHVLNQESRRVSAIAISPDSKLLASGGSNATLRLWDLATGELLQVLQGNATDGYLAIVISPSGRIFGSGSPTSAINVWDFVDCQFTGHSTLTAHVGIVQALAISPQGTLLASGSRDMTVKLWDLQSGKLIRTLHGHLKPIHSLAFSADGTILSSGDSDGVIKIWSMSSQSQPTKTGEPLMRVDAPPQILSPRPTLEELLQLRTRPLSEFADHLPLKEFVSLRSPQHLKLTTGRGGKVAPASDSQPNLVEPRSQGTGRVKAVLILALILFLPLGITMLREADRVLRGERSPTPAPVQIPPAQTAPQAALPIRTITSSGGVPFNAINFWSVR